VEEEPSYEIRVQGRSKSYHVGERVLNIYTGLIISYSIMKLKEIHRTSTFAWSPTPSLPLLATGTVAGALDESFSNESQLEIWAPDFLDKNEYDLGDEGQHGPKGAVKDNARCVCLPGSGPKVFTFQADSTGWLGVLQMVTDLAALLQQEWKTENSPCGIPPKLLRKLGELFETNENIY
jgi:hypothetical protein